MQRSRWLRILATLVAVWFGALVAEPAALHPCPMHDGASADMHAPHLAHHHGDNSHRAPHHGCTCAGACCVAATAAVPVAAVSLEARERPVESQRPPLQRAFRPSAPEHARPPSLGPPVLPA